MKWTALLSAIVGLTILLSSCGNEEDIRSFYFPARELTKGLVYEYQPLAGTDDRPIYWYTLATDLDTALYLTVTTYDTLFMPASMVREEITNAGVLTREVRLYATDSSGVSQESIADIMAANAFPFFLDREQRPAYVYKIAYVPPQDENSKITITYNRQFSRDTSVTVLGEILPALVFNLTGETDINDPINGSMTPTFAGYEIYAKGIGLVESYRDFNGFVFHNKLADRISMAELLERARKND